MKMLAIFIIGLTFVGLYIFGISPDSTGVIDFGEMFNGFANVIGTIQETTSKVIDFILELFT